MLYFRGTDNKLWSLSDDGSGGVNLGGYETISRPTVSGDYIYFQGTDNKLWKVRLDGTDGVHLGGYDTASTPFVTDLYVYFRGTDNKLWRINLDGTGGDNPGGYQTASMPFVTDTGVYFQGTGNALWKINLDGTGGVHLGGYDTRSTPFVTADHVYFQGTDNALWKINLDGTGGVHLGGYDTRSTPFVTADHVYFQGTDNALWKINLDGTGGVHLGGYNTASSPFVADRVYFQGTDNALWAIALDGTSGIHVGGYDTSSTPFHFDPPFVRTEHRIVVLSDVHIGNDAPTVWYQSSIHNRYLGAICNWIVANAPSIRELVLLGDVVDFWTQPANVKPPSLAEIVAKQPAIFGPNGFFGQVLDALGGAVTLIPGNHDIGITAAEVATIVSAGGHRMKFADSVYYPMGDHSIALAHGNAYTIFNAPDPNSPWNYLPIGHFVTRMVATHWARTLPPGHTVATLPGQGAPNGFDVGAAVKGVIGRLDIDVAEFLLDQVAAQTGTPADQQFILPSGQTVSLNNDVRPAYSGLFSRWVANSGGGVVGLLIAGKSALADAELGYMGWFAQRQAFESGADLIVFGHTHNPISGLTTTLINYANSGFECPSTADMPPKLITFAVVDTNTLGVEIMQVTKDTAQVALYPNAPKEPVVPFPAQDFSCYVIIENHGQRMDLEGQPTASSGYWVVPPPQSIPAGGRAMIWLQDYPGLAGTDGAVTYSVPGRGPVRFTFRCPTLASNDCSGGTGFVAKSGGGAWGEPGSIPRTGHPFYVKFEA